MLVKHIPGPHTAVVDNANETQYSYDAGEYNQGRSQVARVPAPNFDGADDVRRRRGDCIRRSQTLGRDSQGPRDVVQERRLRATLRH